MRSKITFIIATIVSIGLSAPLTRAETLKLGPEASSEVFDCSKPRFQSGFDSVHINSKQNNLTWEAPTNITIKNCEISVGENGTAIYLDNNMNSNIINNKLNNQKIGLYLNWETQAIIKENTINFNEYGIWIQKSSIKEISGNKACNNDVYDIKIASSNIEDGANNEFEIVEPSSDGWPVLDKNYVTCA